MAEQYRNYPVVTLPPHPLYRKNIPANGINRKPEKNKWKKEEINKFLKILENFVDYFINICEPKVEEHLTQLS